MYEVINCSNALNLRRMEYDPICRTRTTPGFEGNCSKWIWGSDKMGLVLVNQAAGMGTITSDSADGFVSHSDCVEIEYLTESVCDLHYPDGTHVEMRPGDCLCHQPGMPHGMLVSAPRNMEVVVVYSCAPKAVDRCEFIPGKDTHACDKWQVKRSAELPGVELDAPGVEAKLLFENNERPICFAEVIVKPGAIAPANNLTAIMNCDEMILAIKGKGQVVYPDRDYPLEHNIALYHGAGQPRRFINTGDEDLVLLCTWSTYKFKEIERQTVIFK